MITRSLTGLYHCMGQLPYCCPIIVQNAIKRQLSTYARIFLHVIGLDFAVQGRCTCNDILVSNMPHGTVVPPFFFSSPPIAHVLVFTRLLPTIRELKPLKHHGFSTT